MSKTARIVVEIQTNEEGELKCAHRPLTPEDRAELESWPSGGLVHMAQALLIETLRRESYVMAISHLSLGFEDLTVKEIEDLTRAHIAQMVDTFAPAVAEETMKRLSEVS
jgi:predicted membrane GTPase involved in stress response